MYEIFRIADRLILSFLTYKSNKFIPRDFDILYLHKDKSKTKQNYRT